MAKFAFKQDVSVLNIKHKTNTGQYKWMALANFSYSIKIYYGKENLAPEIASYKQDHNPSKRLKTQNIWY